MSLADSLKQYNEIPFLSEHNLVDELKYIFLGTDSQSFRFLKPNIDELSIDIKLDVTALHPNQTGPLKEFIQLALIVKKLNISSSSLSTTTTTTKNNLTPSLVAFHACINESLVNFHHFIDDLYNKHTIQNFISLKYHLNDSFTSFRHIYWLYLKSKSLKSNDFISLLYEYSLFGDTIIKNISLSYFNNVSKPYNYILNTWLLLGELNTGYSNIDNFFIKLSVDNNNNNNDSFNKFIFLNEFVPIFIDSNDAYKIFQIGKTINFLKIYLNDKIWCNDYYIRYKDKPFDLINIQSLYDHVISHLNDLLLFDFQNEILYLNNFLLFNQGDLINSIINNGFKILDQPSSTLSGNQLVNLLQESIDSTSIRFNYIPEIYNRLDARLLNINSNTSLGWDLFTLDFKLSKQVNYLVSNTYKEYLRVFNFLLRISKIKFQLSKSWKNSTCFTMKYKMKNNKNLKIIERKFVIVRHQFISFIDLLFTFITNELLSLNYNSFKNNFKRDSDINLAYNLKNNKLLPFNSQNKYPQIFNLDELREIHDNFILSISRSELFYDKTNSDIPLSQTLSYLLSLFEKFIRISIEFESTLGDLSSLEKLKSHTDSSNFEEYESVLVGKFSKIFKELEVEVDHYENYMLILLDTLKNSKNESLKCFGILIEG